VPACFPQVRLPSRCSARAPSRYSESYRTVLPVTVTGLEPRGELARVRADDLSADVTSPAVAELDLAPGAEVYFSIKASAVTVYGF
jgi:molybdate transport system ATP-binding protein